MHYLNEVDNPALLLGAFALNQSQNIMLKRKPHLCQVFGRETTHTNVGKVFLSLPTTLVNMVLHMSQSHLPLQPHKVKGVL